VGEEMFHAIAQTVRTKLTVAFCNFATAHANTFRNNDIDLITPEVKDSKNVSLPKNWILNALSEKNA
jgi:hypothetical protein